MQIKEPSYAVGVIIGRFQVPELHPAHKELIQTVCDAHDKVILFLGLSPLKSTIENPLDYEARKQMILDEFPHVNVLYIKDQHSDEVWSAHLDEQIDDLTGPAQNVVLYGGRDSFLGHYTGKHDTKELESERIFSGTEIRKQVSRKVKASPDFRAGVIWSTIYRYPTCFPCVDVAVYDPPKNRILLGRKKHEDQYRLFGGFADPASPSFEADARREVSEEAGIDITDPEYIASYTIDDWRYRREIDCIKTLLFLAHYRSGQARPGDDIVEVRWFDINLDVEKEVVPNHQEMVKNVIAKITRPN